MSLLSYSRTGAAHTSNASVVTMAHREKVLSLYRSIFRLARSWKSASGQLKDTTKEKKYIIEEAKELFRKNKNDTRQEVIEEHIRECETRIQMALHYGIPYPRPVNIPQNTLAPTKKRLMKSQKRSLEQSKPVYLKSYDDIVK